VDLSHFSFAPFAGVLFNLSVDYREDEKVSTDQLSETFSALADPTRRAILTRLAEGEATVNELAQPFPITLQAVSKHLKVLERAGLVSRTRTAQLRPARLEAARLAEAVRWLERYEELWRDSFDHLETRLRRVKGGR
jgi:DNA-binding transcriptional ArsR family regulator